MAIVLVLRFVLWPKATAVRLPQAQASSLRAAGDVFTARWQNFNAKAGQSETPHRRLQERLLALSASTQDMLAERVGRRTVGELGRISDIVEEISMLALGVPYGRPGPSAAQTSAPVDWLRTSANMLDGSTATEPTPANHHQLFPAIPSPRLRLDGLELVAETYGRRVDQSPSEHESGGGDHPAATLFAARVKHWPGKAA